MAKRIVLWIGMVFLGAFLIFTTEAVITQRALAEKTLRLHVIANSDKKEDQDQKIRLRDFILGEIQSITEKCTDLEEAERALTSAMPELREAAADFLMNEGSYYGVRMSLCTENYGTREYDTFSLPAGEYRSLRIVIGEGRGKNWWCVVFPTLCNAATVGELEHAAEAGAYTRGELALIRREEPKYKLQFKVLEWVRGVFN